jgi:uncharacterized membrane protein YbhN (UPF0104 family)
VLAARVVLPLLVLLLLARRLGAEAFRPALAVVSPVPLLAALVLGGVAVTGQAARWRLLMSGARLRLGRREALAECYRASALNTVLPGGVAGDVLRAWRQRTDAPQGWRPAAACVLADRAVGLCVLLATAAAVLATEAPYIAVALGAMSVVAWAVGRPALHRLSRRQRAAVWAWSVVVLAALLGLAVVVGVVLGVPDGPDVLVTLGLAVLAGMAVPLNLGGWGPREAAGALAALLIGAPPSVGVAVAAGFGLLSTVSVLPGFLAIGRSRLAGTARRGPRQVELHAHVLADNEAP